MDPLPKEDLIKNKKKQQVNNKITNKYKDKVKTEANIKENSIKQYKLE